MITQYAITATAWTAITQAGHGGACWLDAENDGAGGRVDVRIYHTNSGTPSDAMVTEGYPVRTPNKNKDAVPLTPDNPSDVYYARCLTQGSTATLTVDVSAPSGAGQEALTAFGEVATAEFEAHAGWSFSYNINPLLIRTATLNGGTVSHSGSFGVLQTGTASNGAATLRTNAHVTYTPGVGALSRFTAIFDTPKADSTQLVGVGDEYDGWFFGYNGTQFGVMRRKAGVDTWVYQPSWSEDTKESLDPTNLNVYEIRYQWLGGGMQYFAVENDEGNIADVHRIKYANLYTDVSVDIPSLPLWACVQNSGNTTNIQLKTPSAIGGAQGKAFVEPFTTAVGFNHSDTLSSGTTYLFSLYMPSTWLGKVNRLYWEPKLLSMATDGAQSVSFGAVFGATLTAPSWVDIATGVTPLQYDISATAFTGGIEVADFTFAKVDGNTIDLANTINGRLWPSNIMTVYAETAATNSIRVSVSNRSRA